jgi:hemerythrin-like domain-containing protein
MAAKKKTAKKSSPKRSPVSTLLIKQHKEVKAIFKQLEDGAGSKAPALLKQLSDNLAAHMTIEQDIYYPAVKELKTDLVLESYEEHSLAELGLKRLLETSPKDETFKAKVTACKELIEHHVEEEEDELFRAVDNGMSAEDLREMAKEMKARFDQALAAGFAKEVPASPRGFATTSADLSVQ